MEDCMSKDTRRKFMKSSGAAIGTLALTGVASATDNQSAKDEKLELVDKSVVASKGDNKVVAVVSRRNARMLVSHRWIRERKITSLTSTPMSARFPSYG